MDNSFLNSHIFGSSGQISLANALESVNRGLNRPQRVKPFHESMKALEWAPFSQHHYWNLICQARPILKIMMRLPPRLRFELMRFFFN